MSPDLWIFSGIALIAVWIMLAAFRMHYVRMDAEAEINEWITDNSTLKGDTMNLDDLPTKYDEDTVKTKLQSLAAQSNTQPDLVFYVQAIRERYRTKIKISLIKRWLEEAGVRTELINKIIEAREAAGRLKRLEREEELKDAQIEVQLLEAQDDQQKTRSRIKYGEERRERKHQYKMRKLEKKTAELDREPSESKPKSKPRPSREEMLASRLKAEREVREQIQDEEQGELLKLRLQMRPNPTKDKEVYKDEAVWLADWREVGGEQELFVLGEYENIKKRNRTKFNDALEELRK